MTTPGAKPRALPRAALVAGGSVVFFIAALFGIDGLLGGGNGVCQWDCSWYGSIATAGYESVPRLSLEANFGFFPGFPLATVLTSTVTGLGYVIAAMLLNAVYLLAFCWLTFRCYADLGLRDQREAAIFLLAFAFSPWSLYNHVPYTEMQFNLAALGTFICWRRGHFAAAALFGIALTATRVSGVLLPVILAIELIVRERGRIVPLLIQPDARFRALAAMPFGLMAFITYLYFHVGDPLAFAHVQQLGWMHSPWNPLVGLASAFTSGWQSQLAAGAYVLVTVLALVGAISGRIPVPLAAFAWMVPSMSLITTLGSQARYALALFPVYLLAAALPRLLQVPFIALLAVGQLYYVYHWLLGAGFLV